MNKQRECVGPNDKAIYARTAQRTKSCNITRTQKRGGWNF